MELRLKYIQVLLFSSPQWVICLGCACTPGAQSLLPTIPACLPVEHRDEGITLS